MIAEGKSSGEIASTLGITRRTVVRNRRRLLEEEERGPGAIVLSSRCTGSYARDDPDVMPDLAYAAPTTDPPQIRPLPRC